MIRLILTAAVASALPSFAPHAASAQTTTPSPASAEPGRLSGGLLLGANFSDFGGSEDLELTVGAASFSAETAVGTSDNLAAGGFVSYAWNPCWSLRVEALLSARGAPASGTLVLDGVEQGIPFTVQHTLRYVQMPVLLQRSIAYDGRIVPRLYAGPSIAIMLTSRAEGETVVADDMGTISTITTTADIEDVSGRVDVGAMIGAGIGFPAWRGRVLVEARYELFVTRAVHGRYSLLIDDALGPGVELSMNARSLRNRGLSLFVGFEL